MHNSCGMAHAHALASPLPPTACIEAAHCLQACLVTCAGVGHRWRLNPVPCWHSRPWPDGHQQKWQASSDAEGPSCRVPGPTHHGHFPWPAAESRVSDKSGRQGFQVPSQRTAHHKVPHTKCTSCMAACAWHACTACCADAHAHRARHACFAPTAVHTPPGSAAPLTAMMESPPRHR